MLDQTMKGQLKAYLENLKTDDIINYAIEDEVLEEFIGLLLHIQAKKRKRK